MLRDGPNVPLATIAAEAGVGVGTLYRSYPDRYALLHALEYRAYGLLNKILDELDDRSLTGLEAVRAYLSRTLAIADQLVLPLHGAPPLTSPEAVKSRRAINQRLDRFIKRGHLDGSIRAPVNATDIIIFSALTTQPLPTGPGLQRIAKRQIELFANGLAASGPIDIPGPPIKRTDIERAFAQHSTQVGPPGQ
jgi:AcrR family transcriptional regulator